MGVRLGVGDRIRFIRLQARMTHEEFAKEILVSTATYIICEDGRANATSRMLGRIARRFDTSVRWLRFGDGEADYVYRPPKGEPVGRPRKARVDEVGITSLIREFDYRLL